ncbi:DUF1810 domain-containing protein [Sinorhizobium sp. GL28]|uniref:DUF1810 domain-containing protein n=1 Tax=Sinorhizobium sp. GL28 TaxID=1358418 RepID=UPI00071E5AA5|nr:DUF1810 domain-containing protein [Sinorhizobium sp. GL28]KSV88937.1 hypothetical protein N184_08480 [Sinorhizobium sp. GL28]
MPDPFELKRFVEAQDRVYAAVLDELGHGRKRTHWMWFVFPQIAGLGHSPMAERYAISGLDEARAYLAHALLGLRLRQCTELVNAVSGKSAHDIFSSPDDVKFRSSMTLFAEADEGGHLFKQALEHYFGGEKDRRTLDILAHRR